MRTRGHIHAHVRTLARISTTMRLHICTHILISSPAGSRRGFPPPSWLHWEYWKSGQIKSIMCLNCHGQFLISEIQLCARAQLGIFFNFLIRKDTEKDVFWAVGQSGDIHLVICLNWKRPHEGTSSAIRMWWHGLARPKINNYRWAGIPQNQQLPMGRHGQKSKITDGPACPKTNNYRWAGMPQNQQLPMGRHAPISSTTDGPACTHLHICTHTYMSQGNY